MAARPARAVAAPFADKENSNPFTPRAAGKPGLGASVKQRVATPGKPHGLTPQRPRAAPSAAAAATPSAPTPSAAGETTTGAGLAADTLNWARKISLERSQTEKLPREQRHERLSRLYQEATQAIGAVRGGEGAQIWLEYALLQACAPHLPPPAADLTRFYAPQHNCRPFFAWRAVC